MTEVQEHNDSILLPSSIHIQGSAMVTVTSEEDIIGLPIPLHMVIKRVIPEVTGTEN